MASPQHPTTIENLPCEVLSDIFIRLLAKEVAQMRCVSKSWNVLLTDSSFVKSHLNHSIQNNDEILLFFNLIFSFEYGPSPFTARPSCSPDLELANFIKPPVIPQCQYGCGFVIGSVNGLICFSYTSSVDDFPVYIWNPSLSAILTLPPSSSHFDQLHFGFGYDPKTDDYKVVKLTTIYGSTQALVYSMKKGSWKLISPQTFPSHITICEGFNNQVCVDDHLHWLCETDLDPKLEMILAFDLGAETFRRMPLPETILDFKVYKRSNVLGVLFGKLCVISRVRDGKWEVWVMDEYGVSESWVKHHAFSQFSADIEPYGFTSHGEFLVQVDYNDNRFGLYDPLTTKTKTFEIMSRNSYIMIFVEYVDSLVWVPPPNHEISSCDISQLQIGQSEKRKQKTSFF